jgi:hypothetical protein
MLPVIAQSPECCWALFCSGMRFKGSCPKDEPAIARLYTPGLDRKLKTLLFEARRKNAREMRA